MPAPHSHAAADFARGAAFVRDAYLPIDQASIPLTDWGFLRSDAAYDVVTVWDGAFFALTTICSAFVPVARISACGSIARTQRWRRCWSTACGCPDCGGPMSK